MGAFQEDTIDGRSNAKIVLDNVHRNIYLDPLSLKFIDTEQFQRLRDVKQLGAFFEKKQAFKVCCDLNAQAFATMCILVQCTQDLSIH
jgi:hypothetical protein